MKLTKEQFDSLSRFEAYFKTAVHENFARYPGENALRFILSIYNEVTHEGRTLNASCQTCVLNILRDCGLIYLADKFEIESKGKKKSNKKNN